MHWLSAGAGASCPDLSCQRGQTKKQVKKSCNDPKPLRCMPLGYVFYRQFSGLPVSTLAVFFYYNLRKESREKELPVTHVFDEMFVSYNSLKDFFEIHVFSRSENEHRQLCGDFCDHRNWSGPRMHHDLFAARKPHGGLGEWPPSPLGSLGSQRWGSDMIFVLTDAWRQSGRILPHSNKEEVHKVRSNIFFVPPFSVDSTDATWKKTLQEVCFFTQAVNNYIPIVWYQCFGIHAS